MNFWKTAACWAVTGLTTGLLLFALCSPGRADVAAEEPKYVALTFDDGPKGKIT